MSHGEITLPLLDGEYPFNVARHKTLFALQDACAVKATGLEGEDIRLPSGPMDIFNRLRNNAWRAQDVIEPIKLGLMGAGMSPQDMRQLLKKLEDEPLGTLAPIAARIVFAAVYGVQGDDLGKAKADRTRTGADDSASSAPPNTAPAPPSDSPRGT